MKKVFVFLVASVMAMGMFSCETESTSSQEELFIDSPDGDDADEGTRD